MKNRKIDCVDFSKILRCLTMAVKQTKKAKNDDKKRFFLPSRSELKDLKKLVKEIARLRNNLNARDQRKTAIIISIANRADRFLEKGLASIK